jgi:hypothetical protein
MPATWPFTEGAGDGNRTRTVSLGIVTRSGCALVVLLRRVACCGLARSLGAGLNGPCTARGACRPGRRP